MRSAVTVPAPLERTALLPSLLDRFAGRLENRLIRAAPWQVMQVPTREPIVSFTFDDVPDSALRAGAAILEAEGARGTFYISGGLQGRVEPNRTLIDLAGCKELAARGHEIGCHTYAHRDLRHVDSKSLTEDLDRNARYLDAADPRQGRRNFAYPYNSGSFGKRDALARAFRTCRAGGEGINRGPTDPTFLRAVEIRQPQQSVLGLARWIDALAAQPGWLIFFTHDISPTPTPYGCTATGFRFLLGYARARGCRVLPVDAALDQMGFREQAR
ncbi:polysaccharide deacetylase family protein [Bosea vaviloviae]|uniref:polysaccharide deacetylase family protein n=1 Tax=Bosea vaviloviae TaxID=1526658 RepID=UPI0009F511F6|nr:polysaccharide deacetylase family protein [Bosea vaviloviae]